LVSQDTNQARRRSRKRPGPPRLSRGQVEACHNAAAAECIYGPKRDGTYIVEFKTADGEALAINVPAGETRVLKHFKERMPYGLFVPDVA
jgi:hypothetical protein